MKSAGSEQPKFRWGKYVGQKLDPEQFYTTYKELPSQCTNASVEGTPVQESFAGAHILLTGATGFMGRIILEKLLVACPKIAKIYLIVREKKGLSYEERYNKIFNNAVFIRLRSLVPDFMEKIEVVNGDCSLMRMGFSDSDLEKLNQVITHVIHGAATVRFDAKIKDAVVLNVRGVQEMLRFSRNCKNLKCVLHISTAYSNCLTSRFDIEERFYPPAGDYKSLINTVENTDEDTLEKMTPKLLGQWPNTYTLTKQLAEEVIKQEGNDLPVGIVRPAIVTSTYKEPIRSWSDNFFGPTGITFGIAVGFLKVLYGHKDDELNIVPVDTASNLVIVAAAKVANDYKNEKQCLIYNHISKTRAPITWGNLYLWCDLYGRMWPSKLCIWYAKCSFISNRFLYLLMAFFLHTIPSIIADCVLLVLGKQPMLIKGHKKITRLLDVTSYFVRHNWHFDDSKTLSLWNNLSEKDKEIFPFDVADLDWDYFTQGFILGLRKHLVNDPPETLPASRAHQKRLYAVHVTTCSLLFVLLMWLIVKFIKLVWS